MFRLFPHQERAINDLRNAIACGRRSLLLYSPTGSGKSIIMAELSRLCGEKLKRVAIFTHRRILLRQTGKTLERHDVEHGKMSAEYDMEVDRRVQLASVRTINSRVFERESWELPEADLVLIDEAHLNVSDVPSRIINHYREARAVVVGFTGTPVGCRELYDELVIASKNSELVRAGLLVNGRKFACCEPDMKGIRRVSGGEFNQKQLSKRLWGARWAIFGNVWENFRRINPEGRPSVLFAPGLDEARWFSDQLGRRIGVGHVKCVDHTTAANERDDTFEGLAEGRVKIVCNYMVLDVGWDCPPVSHAILIRPFGRLSAYIQAIGRVKRSSPGKSEYTTQDHAGCWWRHPDPDDDLCWSLDDQDTTLAQSRKKRFEMGEPQPVCCSRCGCQRDPRLYGDTCPACGHVHKRSRRVVIQEDGELKQVYGDPIKRKKEKTPRDKWMRELITGAKRDATINQCVSMYRRRNDGEIVPESILGSIEIQDFDRKVVHVYPWTRRFAKQREKVT